MRLAILGATSQIARDLIVSFSADEDKQLHLFARSPDAVVKWLKNVGLSGRYLIDDFGVFGNQEFDAVINFVGVGNPSQALAIGRAIFDLTLRFDELVLNYLQKHPACRYLFLSSGAAYGSAFNEPANRNTPSIVAINNLAPQEWYGVAKLYAECRHRAQAELAIIDIRVFNYFSPTQDIEARFLITDILRAIRDKSMLKTTSDYIMRDFLHPSDFYELVNALLMAPATNTAVDCYTLSPIDKPGLLKEMHENFGLRYDLVETNVSINSTGNKPYYYSLNRMAADFGYQPRLTSLDGILLSAGEFLFCRVT